MESSVAGGCTAVKEMLLCKFVGYFIMSYRNGNLSGSIRLKTEKIDDSLVILAQLLGIL